MLLGFTRRFALPFIFAGALPLPSMAQECRDGSPTVRPKIVGGDRAQLKQWPGQAALRLYAKSAKNALYLCGGAAISERWVLTGDVASSTLFRSACNWPATPTGWLVPLTFTLKRASVGRLAMSVASLASDWIAWVSDRLRNRNRDGRQLAAEGAA